MFHIGRSGSTVLGDMLHQHPGVYWGGEIYSKLYESSTAARAAARNCTAGPGQYLVREMAKAGRSIYGFEIKFFHLNRIGITLPEYLSLLYESQVSHFVVLERRNYLRKIVSSIVACQNRKYHQSAGEGGALTKITLDVTNVEIDSDAKPLLTYLESYSDNFAQLRELLKHQNVLNVTYEDDVCSNPRTGYQRICEFLSISPHPVQIRFGKTNPFPLNAIIENYAQVERELAQTQFAWMLNDDQRVHC